jgi:hypothetical protein
MKHGDGRLETPESTMHDKRDIELYPGSGPSR